ncbi:DUF1513 domain-containing protein [Aquabacter spiritensis]|uniref:DUF1513 domain-containing protein n=1 Tax=Aquabacter spiritensis TaxID=933073 RepID=A0A4R3M364_9HYPH|nr:DUF1513 domain-containing protein [Aquabacter spiritensis]TCT07664.1 hypothetical protein EDC64_101183 [Aquabacter spiritensis]
MTVRLSRRSLLAGAGAALLLPRGSLAAANERLHARAHAMDEGWLTTVAEGDGFGAFALSEGFDAAPRVPSPVRLHGIEASPRGPLAVAVGRRPGRIALVFDRDEGGQVAAFGPAAGRVFSGHGRFTADGALFLTNEIERPSEGPVRTMGRGIVAARDVAGGFQIVAEWPTGGDGPHDLMRSGAALVVANGGIEPNTPEARDAEETGSTISLIDPQSGALRGVGGLPPDLGSLSLRHLARDGRGGTVVAAQDLLKDGVSRPLLFFVAQDGALRPFEAPEAELMALRGYVGSVAFDRSGAYVACATPRGNRVAVWRRDGRYLGAVPLVDGCGLAATREPGRFVATSGYGEVVLIAIAEGQVAIVWRRTGGPRFDNHMVELP